MNIDQAIKISNITVRNHYDESGSTKQELQRFAEAIRNATLDEVFYDDIIWLKQTEIRDILNKCDEGQENSEYILAFSRAVQEAFIRNNNLNKKN